MISTAFNLYLTVEQQELYGAIRELAHEHLDPVARSGLPGRVNRPLVKALAEHGVLARLFANGAGVATELCLTREALARECTEAETAFVLQGLGAHPILKAGRPELIERWIGPVASGDAVAAFALTEPQAGSDVSALSLRADRDGAGFRLTGEKLWISNAPDADVYTVFARTSDDPRRGLSGFVVAGDSEGLSGEPLEMLSPHAIGRLRFEGVSVGAGELLGEPGDGFRIAMRTLDLFRPSVGAFAIGMARSALDAACDHALERHTFGRPLRDYQGVSHRLAEVASHVEAARALVYQAAAAHDAGIADPALAAMSKLLATEIAQEAVDVAIQVHGAVALERGHHLEHLYREVRAPRIYEGASEIQREIIARSLFKSAEARREGV